MKARGSLAAERKKTIGAFLEKGQEECGAQQFPSFYGSFYGYFYKKSRLVLRAEQLGLGNIRHIAQPEHGVIADVNESWAAKPVNRSRSAASSGAV